jgi:hypothetical protein
MPEQKISILREHLIDKVPVSDLCDKHQSSAVVLVQRQSSLVRFMGPLLTA